MAYLVDTSAGWTIYEAGTPRRPSSSAGYWTRVCLLALAVIYQEILQRAVGQEDFEELAAYFGTQRFYHPENDVDSYREMALLYFRYRRAGLPSA